MIARLVLARMNTENADTRILCLNKLRLQYAKVLATAAARSMPLWDLVSHLSPSQVQVQTNQAARYFGHIFEHALIAVIGTQDITSVRNLLKRGAKPATETRLFGNAFSLAARIGCASTVIALLRNIQADDNIAGVYLRYTRKSLLDEAVKAGHKLLVLSLLPLRHVADCASQYYDHIISAAVRTRNPLANDLLLRRRSFSHLGLERRFWNNLCRACAASDNTMMMRTILDKHSSHFGLLATAMSLEDASRHGNREFIQLVLSKSSNLEGLYSGAMYWAARHGDLKILDLLLDSGAHRSADALLSAISAATFNDQVAVILHLAKREDTGDWLRNNGGIALINAAAKGFADIQYLRLLGGGLPEKSLTLSPWQLSNIPGVTTSLLVAIESDDWECVNLIFRQLLAFHRSQMPILMNRAAMACRFRPGFLAFMFSFADAHRELLVPPYEVRGSAAIFQIYLDYGWDINYRPGGLLAPELG
jgi:hypothetical protein